MMLKVDPAQRPDCEQLLFLIDKLRLRNINSLEEFKEIKKKNEEDEKSKLENEAEMLLNTIELPKDLRNLQKRLPKSNYEMESQNRAAAATGPELPKISNKEKRNKSKS